MKVIATNEGFYDNALKRVGDIFEYSLGKGQKLPSWVKKAEHTDADQAERIKAEAEAKEAREKEEKEAEEAKALAEKFNELKSKADALGLTVENEDKLTLSEVVGVYEKAISDKEAADKAEIEATEKEEAEAEALANKNANK